MRKFIKFIFFLSFLVFLLIINEAEVNATTEESNVTPAISSSSAGDNEWTMKKFIGLACGFGIAIAAFGGALAQGKASSAALEGIARNPGASDKLFVPMILALALIESLVIYALIISFTLVGKL